MKNDGFTLVELLGVITILAILAVATFEALDIVNRENKEKAEDIQRDSILSSAISYVPTSKVGLPDVVKGTSGCSTVTYPGGSPATNVCEVRVTLQFLHDEGIVEETVKNPKLDKTLNMTTSYVSIVKVTAATKSQYQDLKGKYDGEYFYQLTENYLEG